jgi:hypothetical protein
VIMLIACAKSVCIPNAKHHYLIRYTPIIGMPPIIR